MAFVALVADRIEESSLEREFVGIGRSTRRFSSVGIVRAGSIDDSRSMVRICVLCVCIEFRQLCSNDEERKSDDEEEGEEEEEKRREKNG